MVPVSEMVSASDCPDAGEKLSGIMYYTAADTIEVSITLGGYTFSI